MPDDIIALQQLRKQYYEVLAIDDVDLCIAAGEIYGLIGPNGAGKTTLLRILATTLEPTAGRALIEGRDVWRDPVATRAIIGFMPDFFQLYGRLKVWELLTYFGIAHRMSGRSLRQRVDEVISLTDLQEKRDSFVRGLSRGMTQRLGLGRAILHRPRVLLLDEPASGLDPMARRSLFGVLQRIHAEGSTILISSHILGELSELCTAVGIMHNGRFLESGRTQEIIRKISPHRKIELRLAGGAEQAGNVLAAHPAVSSMRAGENTIHFLFDGTDEQLAELNAALVRAGAAVALLGETETSLHELYFAIAERDASHAPAE